MCMSRLWLSSICCPNTHISLMYRTNSSNVTTPSNSSVSSWNKLDLWKNAIKSHLNDNQYICVMLVTKNTEFVLKLKWMNCKALLTTVILSGCIPSHHRNKALSKNNNCSTDLCVLPGISSSWVFMSTQFKKWENDEIINKRE